MLQVMTKSRRWIASENDTDRQRDHDQAGEDRGGPDQAAKRRDRHQIAVPDGAERHDGPPHGVRNGAELLRLDRSLDQVHGGRRDQRGADQDHQAAGERPPLRVEHIEKRAHPRRVAREFQEPHDPQHHQDAQVGRHQEGEPERQHGEQVDEAGNAGGEAHGAPAPRRGDGAAPARPRPTGAAGIRR